MMDSMEEWQKRLNALTIALKTMPHASKFFKRHEDGQPSSILKHTPDFNDYVQWAGDWCPLMDTMIKNVPDESRQQSLVNLTKSEVRFRQLMTFVSMSIEHYKENPDEYPLRATIIPRPDAPNKPREPESRIRRRGRERAQG